MARRRKRKSELEQILERSWKEQLVLAVIAGTCALFVPRFLAKNPIFRPLTEMISAFAWLAAIFLSGIALLKFIKDQKCRNVLLPLNRNGTDPLLAMERRGASSVSRSTSIVDAAWDDSLKEPDGDHSTQEKPGKWSLELLREIEWKRFEVLCGAYYAKRGFRVETISCGPDGGIDAKLYFGEIKEPVGLIQCKAWRSKFVGVNIVRELLGVMAHHKVAKGILHATGGFSTDALDFARANKIQCIDGAELVSNIGTLPQAVQQELLALAVEGDYKTPTCTSCGIKMRRVSTKRGDMWGCPNYPRCKVHWNIAQRVE